MDKTTTDKETVIIEPGQEPVAKVYAYYAYFGKEPKGHRFQRLDTSGRVTNTYIQITKLPRNLAGVREGQVFRMETEGDSTYPDSATYAGLLGDYGDDYVKEQNKKTTLSLQALNMIARTKESADKEYFSNDVINAVNTLVTAARRMDMTQRNRLLIYLAKRLG